MAFNEEIGSIEIAQGHEVRVYQRKGTTLLGDNVRVTPLEVHSASGECIASQKVAFVDNGAVAVAVLSKEVDLRDEIEFGATVPKIFIAFPLFGTEGIGLLDFTLGTHPISTKGTTEFGRSEATKRF